MYLTTCLKDFSHTLCYFNLQLNSAQAELAAATKDAACLKDSHTSLEVDLSRLQEELKTLTASHSNDTASAAVDRSALLQAQSDLNAIKVETDSITAAHTQKVAEYAQAIAGLKSHVEVTEASIASLRAECDASKREREDNIEKHSELSVEILELQEAQEKAQDEKVKELAALKARHEEEKEELRKGLEVDLAKAIEAHQAAAKTWEEASAAAGESHSKTLAAALKEAEAAAKVSSEDAQKALAETHAEELWAKEVEVLQKTEALEKQVQTLQADLKVGTLLLIAFCCRAVLIVHHRLNSLEQMPKLRR